MTPQDNIRWYWGDLSTSVKVSLLAELYRTLSRTDRERCMKEINKY